MKTPILLLHGALGSQETLDGLKKSLERDHSVYSFTFKGHGNTAKEDHLQFSGFVDQINEFVINHGFHEVIIFGFSMGGYAGLLFAHSFPEKVKSIITLGTKFEWSPEIAQRETSMLNPESISVKVPRFAEYLSKIHGDKWAELCQSTSELLINLGKAPLLTPIKLSSIECPVYILLGEKDHMVSKSESEETAKALKKGTFTLLPEQPHPIEKVNTEKLKIVLTPILSL